MLYSCIIIFSNYIPIHAIHVIAIHVHMLKLLCIFLFPFNTVRAALYHSIISVTLANFKYIFHYQFLSCIFLGQHTPYDGGRISAKSKQKWVHWTPVSVKVICSMMHQKHQGTCQCKQMGTNQYSF